ncbi:MAG: hypothetical protein KatS3mg102_1814 [Planctomycetota bacterium]|nr:MAG: hypothetical protein KatS3mg102_1814 [Planctomycetota bacterium]
MPARQTIGSRIVAVARVRRYRPAPRLGARAADVVPPANLLPHG